MDLWGDIYLDYTTLMFDVVAMDNGTTMRGASASVNITVSNTCVMDVLFEDITVNIFVDKYTGGMYIRIPKYYVVEFCKFLLVLYEYFKLQHKNCLNLFLSLLCRYC